MPSDIPPGEHILWCGRPDPKSLWRRAYRADWVIIWIAVATAWSFFSTFADEGAQKALLAAGVTLALGAAGLAIFGLLAWLSARASLYVITERRLVIKSGVALPIFVNLPFARIVSADVRVFGDKTGDVSVVLAEGQHASYIALWPSARPFRFVDTEPTLRCVPQARAVAETLGRALGAAAGRTPEQTHADSVEASKMELPAST
nr:photosynthetic complex putative assembly protein PuhB [Rhodoblastus sphagnicola]